MRPRVRSSAQTSRARRWRVVGGAARDHAVVSWVPTTSSNLAVGRVACMLRSRHEDRLPLLPHVLLPSLGKRLTV
jgi:hypothetical protein